MFNPIGIVAVARRLFQVTGALFGIAALLRRVRHALAGRRARHVLFDWEADRHGAAELPYPTVACR
jgi:hypothetical protein